MSQFNSYARLKILLIKSSPLNFRANETVKSKKKGKEVGEEEEEEGEEVDEKKNSSRQNRCYV